MQVIDVKFNDAHPERFSISVLGKHAYGFWKKNSFIFKYEDGQVYFVVTGAREKNRLVGAARSKDEAIQEAKLYLEWWLKECRAIGRLEADPQFKINEEDARGESYFTFQIWTRDRQTKETKVTPFYFKYESGQVFYLGNDKEVKNELIKFYYKSRDEKKMAYTIPMELTVSPRNKKEAIRDAIDYLEWLSDVDKTGVYIL